MKNNWKKKYFEMKLLAEAALQIANSNVCRHEETHRGGGIWTICDGCSTAWADDKPIRKNTAADKLDEIDREMFVLHQSIVSRAKSTVKKNDEPQDYLAAARIIKKDVDKWPEWKKSGFIAKRLD